MATRLAPSRWSARTSAPARAWTLPASYTAQRRTAGPCRDRRPGEKSFSGAGLQQYRRRCTLAELDLAVRDITAINIPHGAAVRQRPRHRAAGRLPAATPSATRSASRACSSCRRDVRTIALRVILCELEEAVALYKVVTQRQLATFTPEQAEAELILTADPETISTNLSPCTSGAEIGRAIVGEKKPCSGRGPDFEGWRNAYTSPLRTVNHSSGLPLARCVVSGV
jgi:hypothetical protein